MRFGIMLPNVGALGDARLLADLAGQAEAAGWDGVYLWDTFQMAGMPGTDDAPTADAWVALAAIALRTERIRLGVRVAALPRRRPWYLARQAVTLDHLSGGRFVLGVGAGDPDDRGFSAFGEELDAVRRAAMLDEGLAIVDGFWSGEPFAFHGEHYTVERIRLLPAPLQRPRIPIWVAARWPRPGPVARAARWDGISPFVVRPELGYGELTPAEIVELRAAIAGHRGHDGPFDVVVDAPVFSARHDAGAQALLVELADAGVTWAIASVSPADRLEDVRSTIHAGPPSTMVVPPSRVDQG